MDNQIKLDTLLRSQVGNVDEFDENEIYGYARGVAKFENVISVVSDLKKGTSRIFTGGFGHVLGLGDHYEDATIWERRIMKMMPEKEWEKKIVTELRFFHYLRQMGRKRRNYYLMSLLRFYNDRGSLVNVMHRIYYIYDNKSESAWYAVCLYGPMPEYYNGKDQVVDSITGIGEELTPFTDAGVLTSREKQVLALIKSGMKTKEIACRLNISKHTVSRHRQTILAKLQVKNSIEACHVAGLMGLI